MRYVLKVHAPNSGISELQIDAASRDDAMTRAKGMGLLPFSVEEVRASSWNMGRRKPKHFPLLLFSQQLLSLLDAGLNLVEAVDALAGKESGIEMKAVLSHLLDKMRSGQSFSAAMETLPEAFPPFYVATLRASERTGGIPESLRRYIAYQNQIDEVGKKVKSAMIYPVLLIVAGSLVTLFLLGYVVPKFSQIYEDRATDLPFLSRMLMQWGGVVANHGMGMLAGMIGFLVVSGWAASRAQVRNWAMKKIWDIPWVGEKLRLFQLARLYRTLGMLLKGGMPMVGALELVPGILSPSLQHQLDRAVVMIKEGKTISDAFMTSNLTTEVAQRMLRVGEQSGNMGDMMGRVAVFYDDELARWIDFFVKIFEPVLMALIGVMVGGIVILMYMPIFDLAGSIQ